MGQTKNNRAAENLAVNRMKLIPGYRHDILHGRCGREGWQYIREWMDVKKLFGNSSEKRSDDILDQHPPLHGPCIRSMLMGFPFTSRRKTGNSMTTASRQCRESSTATGYSPLRTPLTKSIPVIMKSGSSCVSRRKNLFWRLSGRGSISRNLSGIRGWIKPLIMFSTGVIQRRPIWKTGDAALPIISAGIRSVHLQ